MGVMATGAWEASACVSRTERQRASTWSHSMQRVSWEQECEGKTTASSPLAKKNTRDRAEQTTGVRTMKQRKRYPTEQSTSPTLTRTVTHIWLEAYTYCRERRLGITVPTIVVSREANDIVPKNLALYDTGFMELPAGRKAAVGTVMTPPDVAPVGCNCRHSLRVAETPRYEC